MVTRKALLTCILSMMLITLLSSNTVHSSHACYSWDVRPVDLGGPWYDREHYLDVYGTTNPNGRILVQWGRYWLDMSLDPITGLDNGVRFGVHTWWTADQFGAWKSYTYVYEYPC